jgi:4-methyl-5(b-hydroxyethyl)-thiazole monophosphate biosynthesis
MKGLFIFSNDMEDIEALGTKALLSRSGLTIHSATFHNDLNIQAAYGSKVQADYLVKNIDPLSYDFLVIPGGKYVGMTIDQADEMIDLVKSFHQNHKMIAAICAGPRFLGRAGLLDKVPFTAYKGSEVDMPKGIYHPELKALTHEGIITARGAGAVYEFAYEIIKYTLGKEKAKAILDQILY